MKVRGKIVPQPPPEKNIKGKEETFEQQKKTPSTKPTLIQSKHYYNNLNKTFSKIIKKKQSNISDYKIEQKQSKPPT